MHFIFFIFLLLIYGCNSDEYRLLISSANSKIQATNCHLLKILQPNLSSGYYDLNLDEDSSTPGQKVYCDFENGDWTRVINVDSIINDLDDIGDISEINASFYTDPILGIGWGILVNTGGGQSHAL